MPDDIAIEARIPRALAEALGRLASATGKSRSSLVCEALTVFILSEDEFIAAVEEGRHPATVRSIRWSRPAATDFRELIARTRADNPAAARRIGERIKDRVSGLAVMPRMGAVASKTRGSWWLPLRLTSSFMNSSATMTTWSCCGCFMAEGHGRPADSVVQILNRDG
jgi:plasmid stabilization system protein ParE